MVNRKLLIVTGVVLVAVAITLPTFTHLNSQKRAGYPQTTPKTTTVPTIPDIQSLATDTNNARAQNGLPPLTLDPKLNATAAAKCADMVRLDDWNHDLKDGTTPLDFIKQAEPTNTRFTWGENISARYHGTNVSQQVVDGFMGSPGHRANILNAHFTNVGYAICQVKGYPNTVVQQFYGNN